MKPNYGFAAKQKGIEVKKISKVSAALFSSHCSCQDVSANQAKALCTHYNWPLKYHNRLKRALVYPLADRKRDTLSHNVSFLEELRGLQLPWSCRMMRQVTLPSKPSRGLLIRTSQPKSSARLVPASPETQKSIMCACCAVQVVR